MFYHLTFINVVKTLFILSILAGIKCSTVTDFDNLDVNSYGLPQGGNGTLSSYVQQTYGVALRGDSNSIWTSNLPCLDTTFKSFTTFRVWARDIQQDAFFSIYFASRSDKNCDQLPDKVDCCNQTYSIKNWTSVQPYGAYFGEFVFAGIVKSVDLTSLYSIGFSNFHPTPFSITFLHLSFLKKSFSVPNHSFSANITTLPGFPSLLLTDFRETASNNLGQDQKFDNIVVTLPNPNGGRSYSTLRVSSNPHSWSNIISLSKVCFNTENYNILRFYGYNMSYNNVTFEVTLRGSSAQCNSINVPLAPIKVSKWVMLNDTKDVEIAEIEIPKVNGFPAQLRDINIENIAPLNMDIWFYYVSFETVALIPKIMPTSTTTVSKSKTTELQSTSVMFASTSTTRITSSITSSSIQTSSTSNFLLGTDTPFASSKMPQETGNNMTLIIIITGSAAGIAFLSTVACVIFNRSRKSLVLPPNYNRNLKNISNNQLLNHSFVIANTNPGYPMYPQQNMYSNGAMSHYNGSFIPNSSQLTNSNTRADESMTISSFTSKGPLSIPGFLMLTPGQDFEYRDKSKKLGSGATASILVAKLFNPVLIEKNKGERKVAVKVIMDENDNDRQQRKENFHFEIALMSSLQGSPNVVKLIGYCDEPMLIIMRYYPCSLKVALGSDELELSKEAVLKIGLDISNGMAYIHSNGILHLDLKPHNVLLEVNPDQTFSCVICDFGFANVIGRNNQQTVVSGLNVPQTVGVTIRYTPPEVFDRFAQGTKGRVNMEEDKKIDVYAYAITMYEVIFRREAYSKDDDYVQVTLRVKGGIRPMFIPEIANQYDKYPNLIGSVKMGWAHDPTQRPSFEAIRNGLKSELYQKMTTVASNYNPSLENTISLSQGVANRLLSKTKQQ